MPRLTPAEPMAADAKELLDGVRATVGRDLSMASTMAANPALLRGWMELNDALARTLNRRLNAQIAIAIAQANGCGYCLAAHTEFGRLAHVDEDELARSRTGESSDPMIAAALQFALAVNAKAGGVTDDELAQVRMAGYDDADIAAIIGHVALNVLTNSFSRAAHPELDFPEVEPRMEAAA